MAVVLRVLLIEDSSDDAELLLRELRRGGYEPHWERVEEAGALLAALGRESWQLITCDWVMPRLSAPRALEVVRGHDADIPVIVVSGEVGEEFAVTAMKAGAHDFIAKQRLARLVPAVARELRDAETRRVRRSAEAALADREAALRRQVDELETICGAAKRREAELCAQAADLAQANADLERRVAEGRAAVEAANGELRAFTASIAHDLRAPLRAVTGFADALHEDCRTQLDEQGRLYLERLRAAARRTGALFDSLLALSRIMQRELEPAPVDLGALAAEIAHELQRAEPARQVHFAIAPNLLAHGDPILLRAALVNLLGNAWKFSRDRQPAHIEIGRTGDGTRPAFFVRDDGAGFDPQQAPRLFRPFARLHAETDFDGNGVGLTAVQRIIQRHGGEVWADGETGRGATFYFTLG